MVSSCKKMPESIDVTVDHILMGKSGPPSSAMDISVQATFVLTDSHPELSYSLAVLVGRVCVWSLRRGACKQFYGGADVLCMDLQLVLCEKDMERLQRLLWMDYLRASSRHRSLSSQQAMMPTAIPQTIRATTLI